VAGALQLCRELDALPTLENALIVAIICDRGDRYLSTGVFDAALQ
jgi:cysteine synthase B